ncbi:hypothetical protein HanPI659440_Chr12g0477831 [Helianthus annuus]|nr:hypothetical protein HanPI659440_Chr12g0477831 [Helianthus annuus]
MKACVVDMAIMGSGVVAVSVTFYFVHTSLIMTHFVGNLAYLPESCFAGSRLEHLEFVVVNSNGEVDVNSHVDEEETDKLEISNTIQNSSACTRNWHHEVEPPDHIHLH